MTEPSIWKEVAFQYICLLSLTEWFKIVLRGANEYFFLHCLPVVSS